MARSVVGTPGQKTRWRDGVIVSASVVLHGLVLGYLSLETAREPRRYGVVDDLGPIILPLDLTPIHFERDAIRPLTGDALRPAPEPLKDTTPTAATRGAVRQRSQDTTPGPEAPGIRPQAETAAGYFIDDPWRVRSTKGTIGRPRVGIPCPPQPGDRLGERLCALGSTSSGGTTTEYAEVAPSRRDPSDQRREEGFDRQARANEAWRSYTRDGGAYPGLRSLFTEH